MTSYKDHLDKLEEDEYREMEDLAEHLDCSIDSLGWGQTVPEKFRIFNFAKKGWIVKKNEEGEEYSTVKKITLNKGKKKKDGSRYEYGRIQISVPVDWVGCNVEVYVTKKYTPELKHTYDEISFDEIVEEKIDPSSLLSIVHKENYKVDNGASVLLDKNGELIPARELYEKAKNGEIKPSSLIGPIKTNVLVQIVMENNNCSAREAWDILNKK